MKIDSKTKIIARFHKQESPRGLNIYNPYFEEVGINAIYTLFYNPDPSVLINGFRSLNLPGAITAGFESDEVLPKLLDEIDDTAKFVGKIGYITNNSGKVTGHSQGGLGMLRTIKSISNLNNKHLVIAGAGNVTKGLLFEIEKEGLACKVSIYNRDLEKAINLKDRFKFVESVESFNKIGKSSGDIFVNLTDIGGSVLDYEFSKEMINRFSHIVDVTFEREDTKLVNDARSSGKIVATGWDMFTYQAQVCIEGLLGISADPVVLKRHVSAGLSETVT